MSFILVAIGIVGEALAIYLSTAILAFHPISGVVSVAQSDIR